MTTKAKQRRQKRALERFAMLRTFKDEDDDYARYYARKMTEKAALQIALKGVK